MNVLPLADASDHALVGGKAANLARLIAAGAPVPDGFVISNAALQHFVAEQEALPGDVDLAVLAAWSRIGDGPVIVRSSAVGEDSQDASFAGQLDSVAGVTTREALREAILQVWGSQWSARALSYQSAREIFLAGMGVVVQRQVDAQISGVLFTVSPNSPSHMLVEYCLGLGEALVSGAVNPGQLSIARRDFRWKQLAVLPPEGGSHTIGLGWLPPSGGSTAPGSVDALLLNDVQIAGLARLALDIERTFGAPQDIEWTIDRAGKLWIVQSRPITKGPEGPRVRTVQGSVGALPVLPDPPARPDLWSNANVNENFPQPICPLLYSVARAGYYHYFRNLGRAFGVSKRRLRAMEPALRQIIGVHGARMYYNLTSIHAVLRSAPYGEQLARSFNQFVGAGDVEPDFRLKAEATQSRSAPDCSRLQQADTESQPRNRGFRGYQLFEIAVIAAKTTWQYMFLTARVVEFERTVDRFAAEAHPARLAAKSMHALLADLRAFMDIRCNRWKNASLADAGSMVCYSALERLLARAFPDDDQQALHNTLLKALPNLVSSVPPLRMWALSRMIRNNEALHRLVADESTAEVLARIEKDQRFVPFRESFHTFLDQWGFRCSAELMLTVPSFQEDPAPVIDLLRAYAAMEGESPADLVERQAAERVRDTKRVLGLLRRRPLSRWMPFIPQSWVVGTVLRWAQTSIQLRERARLKQALLYSRLRRVALALGDRFARKRRLAAADDIFLLTVDEIDLLASGSEMFPAHVPQLVVLRREAHMRLSATTPPDSMRLDAGEYFEVTNPADNERSTDDRQARLTGVGACGGSTTATAAILLDVTESHRLRRGDILVTRQTDPGWGPIFPLISGLVIERGGMLSHGAIIAREFGIPSVVGVKDATRLIRHGGSITVDGDRGLVHLEVGAVL